MRTIRRFLNEEHGTETVEWAIIIGLIAVGAITMAVLIGGHVTSAFTKLETGLNGV